MSDEELSSTKLSGNLRLGDVAKGRSKYLAKEDVGVDGMILTVSHFTEDEVKSEERGIERKTVVHWKEEVKPMILGPTTKLLLALACDVTEDESLADTYGKQVCVFNDPSIMFGKKMTGGLRIKKIPGAPKAPRQQPVQRSDKDPDDNIPF